MGFDRFLALRVSKVDFDRPERDADVRRLFGSHDFSIRNTRGRRGGTALADTARRLGVHVVIVDALPASELAVLAASLPTVVLLRPTLMTFKSPAGYGSSQFAGYGLVGNGEVVPLADGCLPALIEESHRSVAA